MEKGFKRVSFGARISSMLKVDFTRMFSTPFLYILLGACLVMPVLILVMTTMMDGSVSVDPQTGAETVIEGFDNVWQIIGTVSTAESTGMEMDMISMCNVNMLYFFVAVLVCVFTAGDFRSGYAKNLFAVRSKKTDYVISKTLVCFAGGALMILAFFAGSLLGGAVSGLPFDMAGFDTVNVVMCVLSKMAVVGVFVPIYLVAAVIGKQKMWLSLIVSFMAAMLLFMMVSMITPLDATVVHVGLCLAGGVLSGIGLGAISNIILKKTSLV